MTKIIETDYEGFKAFNLSNSFISLTIIPSLGGKIVSLQNKKSGLKQATR